VTLFVRIAAEAKNLLNSSRGSHDWEHTTRVLNTALHIAKKERADLAVVRIAAVLHDIGRESEDRSGGVICHAREGARRARKILEQYGVNKTLTDAVVHCIETHRFRGSRKPVSKEARVLFDADKLDSIGAVGIGRAFLFAGEVGAKLHDRHIDLDATVPYSEEDTAYREYLVKLRHVKDRMLTAEGKRLARSRHTFMARFFKQLNAEVEGKL
jgi:uncharacterized protein